MTTAKTLIHTAPADLAICIENLATRDYLWIDLTADADETFQQWIEENDVDEFIIADTACEALAVYRDRIGNDIDTWTELAELIESEPGNKDKAIAYAQINATGVPSADDLEGLQAWSSFKDYAEHTFDDLYLPEIPKHLRFYIDYDAFARSLETETAYTEVVGRCFIYNN